MSGPARAMPKNVSTLRTSLHSDFASPNPTIESLGYGIQCPLESPVSMRVCACACLFCAHHSKLLLVRSIHASKSRMSSSQGAWPFSSSRITGKPSRCTIWRNLAGEMLRYSLAGFSRKSRRAELSHRVISSPPAQRQPDSTRRENPSLMTVSYYRT